MPDDVDLGTVRPHLQLIDRRRPECITSDQQCGVSLLPKPLGQFGDGGYLADTVHSHGENDEGTRPLRDELVDRRPCVGRGCPGTDWRSSSRTFSAAENSLRASEHAGSP